MLFFPTAECLLIVTFILLTHVLKHTGLSELLSSSHLHLSSCLSHLAETYLEHLLRTLGLYRCVTLT